MINGGIMPSTDDKSAHNPLVRWRPQLMLGIPELDADHHRLVDLVNQADAAVRSGAPRLRIGEVLVALLAYTKEHFAREEKVMRALDFPGYDAHKACHDELVDQLKTVAAHFVDGDTNAVGAETLKFLADWLVDHIIGEDLQIRNYARGKRPWC